MNRNICLDFYEHKLREAFTKWNKTMHEIVHPDYQKYNITDLDDADHPAIFFYKNNNDFDPYRFLLNRFEDGENIIQTFYNYMSDFAIHLPKYYYYSNGSNPRNDSSFGWN